MRLFNYILGKLADLQRRYPYIILAVFALFTVFMVMGVGNIEFEGDMEKQMPQELPIFKLNDQITNKMGGQDTMFILLEIDETQNDPLYTDILEPEIVGYASRIQDSLRTEPSIEEVISIAPAIEMLKSQTGGSITKSQLEQLLESNPELSNFISDDRKAMIMMITADVGSGTKKIEEITSLIDQKIAELSLPPSVTATVTGSPSVIAAILTLLKSDALYTLLIAMGIIYLLLLATLRSFKRALVISIPLILAVVWTIGFMGWIDLKISVATAGLGAMILGLGVEYGIFLFTRYHEERDKGNSQEGSLKITVPAVGSAVLGSGMTTIVGFLALTLSIMPMLQNLGLSLAIGIFFSIVAAIVIEPILIVGLEDFQYYYVKRQQRYFSDRLKYLRGHKR